MPSVAARVQRPAHTQAAGFVHSEVCVCKEGRVVPASLLRKEGFPTSSRTLSACLWDGTPRTSSADISTRGGVRVPCCSQALWLRTTSVGALPGACAQPGAQSSNAYGREPSKAESDIPVCEDSGQSPRLRGRPRRLPREPAPCEHAVPRCSTLRSPGTCLYAYRIH